MPNSGIKLGIISALQEEQHGLLDAMKNRKTELRAKREYSSGELWGLDAVCVLSRIGKVAAATTATTLIDHFGVTHLLFTGVAGGAETAIEVGDIVVAEHLVQHDMDCRPLFPRFEVPLTGASMFFADRQMTAHVLQAAREFVQFDYREIIGEEERQAFRLQSPKVRHGLLASGDQFIAESKKMSEIRESLPGTLAVEMEGAAVAQVCTEFGIPFAVVRTISDSANEDSPVDFARFVDRVAARYAYQIVRRTCARLV